MVAGRLTGSVVRFCTSEALVPAVDVVWGVAAAANGSYLDENDCFLASVFVTALQCVRLVGVSVLTHLSSPWWKEICFRQPPTSWVGVNLQLWVISVHPGSRAVAGRTDCACGAYFGRIAFSDFGAAFSSTKCRHWSRCPPCPSGTEQLPETIQSLGPEGSNSVTWDVPRDSPAG